MKNNKIKSGVIAIGLGAVLVGGTFAWLGSTDNVGNIFSTKGADGFEDGVDIYEKFQQGSQAIAGVAVEKVVQVKNTADYDSLIRVEMDAKFEKEGLDKSHINLNKANIIQESDLQFNEDGTLKNGAGKWVEITEDNKTYYYYVGNVKAKGFTDKILDSVTLSSEVSTNPNYIAQAFNVDINAYSIQSTVEAITDKTNGNESHGALGTQLGFGLDSTKHENLVKALSAVVNSGATTCDTNYGTSATIK